MRNFKIYKNNQIYLYDTKFLKNISELLHILYIKYINEILTKIYNYLYNKHYNEY